MTTMESDQEVGPVEIQSAHYGPFWSLWSDGEIICILSDARDIDHDKSLRVNSDGSPVRALGHWEEMRLDQRDYIRHALKVGR